MGCAQPLRQSRGHRQRLGEPSKAKGRLMGRCVRRCVSAGLLLGVSYTVWRWVQARKTRGRVEMGFHTEGAEPAAGIHIPSQVVPPGGPETEPPGAMWVEPIDGVCPASHPVKVTSSKATFYAPDEPTYEDAIPDRCYLNTNAAQADGYLPGEQ